jgi:catechol 2,3-dioxygenase-like lactoylglutathione lyase family enzyme
VEIKKLSHVCLSTKNLEKVRDFYINILKFKIVHEFINKNKETYGYFINVGNNSFIEFFLVEKIENSNLSSFRHLCFEVYNIDNLYKRLKKKFPKIKIKIGKTDGIKQFFVKDFENNIIEFHQR